MYSSLNPKDEIIVWGNIVPEKNEIKVKIEELEKLNK